MIQATVDPNKDLIAVLASFRGPIVDAHLAYPDVLHLEVRDGEGGLWRFATQDATWSPSDPSAFSGRAVVESAVDVHTGKLTCELSDGSVFMVTPATQEAPDDPPNWELFMPDGRLLQYGPSGSWRVGDADAID